MQIMYQVLTLLAFTISLAVCENKMKLPGQEEERCNCLRVGRKKLNVDCSFSYMSKIPVLQYDVTFLNLQFNSIEIISSGVLGNLSQLSELDISYNKLSRIEPGAFAGLCSLKKLILQNNALKYNTVSFPLGIFKPLKSLNYLNIKFNDPSNSENFPSSVLSDLAELTDLELDVFESQDSMVFPEVFMSLKRLQRLVVGNCTMNTMNNTFTYLPYLHYIDMSSCTISNYQKGTLYKKNLTFLSMPGKGWKLFTYDQNVIHDLNSTNLTILVMKHSTFSLESAFHYTYLIHSGLRELYINNNNLRKIINRGEPVEFCLPSTLEILDLSNNKLRQFCVNLRNVTVLSLRNIFLGPFLEQNLCNLRRIDLSFNRIEHFSFSTFRQQINLKFINLSYNNILDISFDVSYINYSTILDLSSTNISFLDPTIMSNFSELMHSYGLKLNLSNNIFECKCKGILFLVWICNNSNHLVNSENYECEFDDGSVTELLQLRDIIFSLQINCMSYNLLAASLSIIILLAFAIQGARLVFKYRWRLLYMYYRKRRIFSNEQSVEKYKFNAFIAYSKNDRDFVLNDCIQNLEGDGELKLCIHHRDFLPGEEITANITNAIHESKKTICIISKSFFQSYYCMFEYNMALTEGIYEREEQNVLILVFYEQIMPRDLPLVIQEQIRQRSYILYRNDGRGNVDFWKRVKEAIM
ncbi:toll-like receptor 4 [Mytilus californianus]|uniref:toll-like receptor 4 n=1 Tax=Mytilus californianus TaxID=6549 RepID=UPI0022454531|nr:toll-like receptor 4 [Mytilus californianus]